MGSPANDAGPVALDAGAPPVVVDAGGFISPPASIFDVQYTYDTGHSVNSPPAASYVTCPGDAATSYYHAPDGTQSWSFRYLPAYSNTSSSLAFIAPTTPNSTFSRITVAEFGAPPTTREVAISNQPCDFTKSTFGNTATIMFTVGLDPPSPFGNVYRTLEPGKLYFFNVRQRLFDGSSSCGSGASCTYILEYQPALP